MFCLSKAYFYALRIIYGLSMKKLLLITDSLGLPRLFPEKTEYEDTYPNLLKKHFIIMQYSKGGGTIIELYEQTGYFKAFEPDVIILQSGIVDCAPRPYPYWLQQMSKYSYLYLLFHYCPRKSVNILANLHILKSLTTV